MVEAWLLENSFSVLALVVMLGVYRERVVRNAQDTLEMKAAIKEIHARVFNGIAKAVTAELDAKITAVHERIDMLDCHFGRKCDQGHVPERRRQERQRQEENTGG